MINSRILLDLRLSDANFFKESDLQFVLLLSCFAGHPVVDFRLENSLFQVDPQIKSNASDSQWYPLNPYLIED